MAWSSRMRQYPPQYSISKKLAHKRRSCSADLFSGGRVYSDKPWSSRWKAPGLRSGNLHPPHNKLCLVREHQILQISSVVGGCTLEAYPGLVFEVGDGKLIAPLSLRFNITSGKLTAPWTFRITNPNYATVVQSFNWQSRKAASGNISGG
jgi:hypothetical protein